jgi:glycosyltransferase involved in cell wall biosynthesis
VKVSVIVPVYNTGDDLKRCADSVLGQTMDDHELIFVDDGSDDGTERLLDRIAAGNERVRVIHLPPSGGPGGPRNTGIDAARGDYVYFLDDDDWLGEEALERMYAAAVRNDADIVIGKMVGHGRRVPRAMFRRNIDRADVLKHNLLGILTPHKLFRRSFIAEHALRFPEGPVRLEDHRFVLRAYLRAGTISTVGDYPCCHWMKRAGSYSRNLPDPSHFHAVLREVLDIVDEHVEPGTDRDRYYAHWYRGKILKRMGEDGFLDAPAEYRRAYYEESRRLAAERFGPGVDARLPVRMRVRSALLRAGAHDDLFRLLEAERGVTVEAVLDGARRHGDRLEVSFHARLTYRDGTPLAFPGERWEPPVTVDVPAEIRDVTADPCRLDLYIRRRADGADQPLPVAASRAGGLAASGEAVIDPDAHPPLTDGVWDLYARLDAGGWIYDRRLEGFPEDLETAARGRLGVYRTVNGNLSIRVGSTAGRKAGRPLRRVVARIPGARKVARRLRP